MATLRQKKLPSSQEHRQSVGFSAITNQAVLRVLKKGFDFCVMVAGESGLGKSTLINTLFVSDENMPAEQARKTAEQRIEKTVSTSLHKFEITEKNVRVAITIVDTPGFSDAVDNTECWVPVVNYIDQAYKDFLIGEFQVDRTVVIDNRVHCLLYFISPSAHGLKPLDVQVLTALHHKVNIIPIIGKADMLTKSELKALKESIRNDLERHSITVYSPPQGEEISYTEDGTELSSLIPFAVVGANKVIDVGGRQLRGRAYPWGVVEVDNPEHCDFDQLRKMLIRTHTQELKDHTTEVLYENWRREALARDPGLVNTARVRDPAITQDRERKLDDDSDALAQRHEAMKREIAEQQRALEETRRQIEEERRRLHAMREAPVSAAQTPSGQINTV